MPSSIAFVPTRATSPTVLPTALHQSSEDDGDDASSTINIAVISTAKQTDHAELLQTVLKDHPFCKMMTSVELSISDIPTSTWDANNISHLQQADIACFATTSAVQSYLKRLDEHNNIDKDISDEDRRKLPNKPDLVSDIILASESTASATTDGLMAACPSTDAARECLNSGRWMSNHIYYPKDASQEAVELKTESIASGEGESVNEKQNDDEVEDIDMQVWADSVVQAAGDVMERKFWGGGW